MNDTDILNAKDKDLPASLIAIKRAAVMARELAIQTNTDIILYRDGEIVRVTAEMLRQSAKA